MPRKEGSCKDLHVGLWTAAGLGTVQVTESEMQDESAQPRN